MKAKTIDNETLFEEFEQTLEEKYGHMAEEMLTFFDDFTSFFTEQNLSVTKFTKKHIDQLMGDYLNYERLTEAECSMAYQILLDFADFCTNYNISLTSFKTFLEKEKEIIYGYWIHDTESLLDSQELLDNFDVIYPMVHAEIKNKKPDIDGAITFIENIHHLINRIHTFTQKTQHLHPRITDEELQKKIDEKFFEETEDFKRFEFSEETIFSLPKPQAKKIVEIGCKLQKLNQFEFGSRERTKAIEHLLTFLEDVHNELKRVKGKKK